jgi:hypothetical protein
LKGGQPLDDLVAALAKTIGQASPVSYVLIGQKELGIRTAGSSSKKFAAGLDGVAERIPAALLCAMTSMT